MCATRPITDEERRAVYTTPPEALAAAFAEGAVDAVPANPPLSLAPIETAVPPEMENHETHEARETPAPEGAGIYVTPPAAAAIAMADPVTTNPPFAPEEDLNAEGAEDDAEAAEDGARPEVVCHSFREGEEIAGAAGTCRAGSRVFSFTMTRTLREGAWRLRVEEGAMPATQRAAEAVADGGAEIRPLVADALLYGSAREALAVARGLVGALAARRLAKTLAARRKRARRKAAAAPCPWEGAPHA